MSEYLVPTVAALTSKLKFLYGEQIKIASGAELDAGSAVCAIYISADGKPAAAALCDVEFGCYAGAALSMIPAATAEEAARNGEVPENLLENLQEVLNICANLFMDDSTPHLRLQSVYASVAATSADAQALISSAKPVAFRIDFPRYGSGVLSLLS